MLVRFLEVLLLAVCAVDAFKDTSPFFLLSSEPLRSDTPLRSATISTSQDVVDRLIQTLDDCDKSWYYIFNQAGVSESDFRAPHAMPKLQKAVAGMKEGGVVDIPNVKMSGNSIGDHLKTRLEKACAARGKKSTDSWPESADEYRIIEMSMESLPANKEARAKIMRDTDDGISDTVTSIIEDKWPSVIIYITTPQSSQDNLDQSVYEMDEPYPSALHTDLKRDVDIHARQSDENNDDFQAGLPLFQQYQFLTPALFMGLTVSLFLVLLLWVGVSAIAGLEVSYAAFNKEMGPQAQNKGKQQ